MAIKRNLPKRRRNHNPTGFAVPALDQHNEPCEACRVRSKRIRLALSVKEAQQIANALKGTELGEYFQAHALIATRRDPYDEY